MIARSSSIPAFDGDDLLYSHPVATLLIDRNAVILFANGAAEQLFNISRSGMVGRVLFDVVGFDPAYRRRIQGAAHADLFAHASEIIIGGGRRLPTDLHLVEFGGEGHRILALAPSQRDADLPGGTSGRSSKAASAAATMLAHEIKNPLAGIRGAAQLIARQQGSDPARFTDLICAEVDRIATLIDQMEHFSRGQALGCSAINLYPALVQAFDAVRARDWESVSFSEQFDPSLPQVHGHHDAIVQVVMNLLTNACEAVEGQDGARVQLATAYRLGLSVDHGDGRRRVALPIEVTVSDNGSGVPDDIRDALFAPFVTTKREGRGLGLALVARLVRDMGGTIQHARDHDQTHFRVHLPVGGADNGAGQ